MEVAIIITFICFIPFLGDGNNHKTDIPPFNLNAALIVVLAFLFFCFIGGATLLRDLLSI